MLVDTFGRKIDYLRVSLTKQCNFRCVYCMPDTPEDFFDKTALPLPKLLEFIKIALDNGITKIRLTGGEPLLKGNITEFIAGIYGHNPNTQLALTTNGFLLVNFAEELKRAGLKQINVSLDSLKRDRVITISKRDALPRVLEGIERAQEVGLKIKLNMVALKYTQDEILDMLEFAKARGITLRYIEFMENVHAKENLLSLTAQEILEIISSRYDFTPVEKENVTPAKLWQIKDKSDKNYVFGIIAPHEDDFCSSCNRIRLTSDGILCPCLFYQDSVNVREAILNGDKAEMERLLKLGVFNKPEKNQWVEKTISQRAFYYTGG